MRGLFIEEGKLYRQQQVGGLTRHSCFAGRKVYAVSPNFDLKRIKNFTPNSEGGFAVNVLPF